VSEDTTASELRLWQEFDDTLPRFPGADAERISMCRPHLRQIPLAGKRGSQPDNTGRDLRYLFGSNNLAGNWREDYSVR
jgi:hypothetical protein